MDQNLVAITPFEVLGSALVLWKQGFVDVLSANLDGAGALRTVSPTVVMHRWEGRADRASAIALARSTGAGISIFGRLEPAGLDSVRCIVWIDDASSDERLGEVELRESAERMDRLGDSLSIGIVRALGNRRASGAARIGSLGSRSLPAIKFFLQGEQFLRRSSLDSARQAYERAVAIDSTFGLAMNRLGVVLGWQGTASSEEANRLMLTAARFASGLAPRDSLQLTAGALYARLMLFEPDTAWWTRGQDLLRTLRALSARSPGDQAVWNAIGEAYFHLDGALGVSWDDALTAFDRAIALDSNFAPAWVHPIAIVLARQGSDSARRYVEGLQRVQRSRDQDSWPAIVHDIISPHPPTDTVVDRRLAALPAEGVFEVWASMATWPDSAERSIRVARAMRRSRPSGNAHFDDPVVARGLLVKSLLDRGHFRDALRTGGSDVEPALPYLAVLGVIARDSANAVFDGWVRQGNKNAHTALVWWAAQRDTMAIRRFAERARLGLRSDSAGGRHFTTFEVRAADAYLALARRDSARALSVLRALPDSLCPLCFAPRLTLAELLLETGRDAAADSLLRRDLTALPFRVGPADAYWRIARGRAAEQLGDTARAAMWYRDVMQSHKYGDPEARAIATAAERRLSAAAAAIPGSRDGAERKH
jgi:serine/threonine-protein kinase